MNEFELSCVGAIVHIFNLPFIAGAKNAVKSDKLIENFNSRLIHNPEFVEKFGIKILKSKRGKDTMMLLTRVRLGRIIAHIRAQRLAFIAGTSSGYFLAVTDEEKHNEIQSMYQRIMGLLTAINGMERMDFKGSYDNFHNYEQKMLLFMEVHK